VQPLEREGFGVKTKIGSEELRGDWVEVFLAELKNRRERLAEWMQFLDEEFGAEGDFSGVSWHRCGERRR
jgi:hypothetical protein